MDTFFLTFVDDRRDSWVRIEASTRDEARACVIHRFGATGWDELLNDVVFNPDLYRDGEIEALRIEARR